MRLSLAALREVHLEDLRRELTVADWWDWVRSTYAELKKTDEGREYMRFSKGPIKRLKEEVVPTLRLAERQFPARQLLVTFPAEDTPGSPDALIRSSRTSGQVPIQVTCDWGYDDERRLHIMHRDGFVAGSGSIHKVNDRLETKGRAYSIEEVVSEFSLVIANRIAAKAAHSGYDPSTWLVVHINDERLPPEGLGEVLSNARTAAAGSPFSATFLVGSSDEKRICAVLDGFAAIPS
jgi:hypothetical protein